MEYKNVKCKIVFVGDSEEGGKTSIIERYIQNKFYPYKDSTIGASYADKNQLIKEYSSNMEYSIFDCSGNEKYRSLIRCYIKNANVIIFVYDITKRKSFLSIKNKWYPIIRNFFEEQPSKIYNYYSLCTNWK